MEHLGYKTSLSSQIRDEFENLKFYSLDASRDIVLEFGIFPNHPRKKLHATTRARLYRQRIRKAAYCPLCQPKGRRVAFRFPSSIADHIRIIIATDKLDMEQRWARQRRLLP